MIDLLNFYFSFYFYSLLCFIVNFWFFSFLVFVAVTKTKNVIVTRKKIQDKTFMSWDATRGTDRMQWNLSPHYSENIGHVSGMRTLPASYSHFWLSWLYRPVLHFFPWICESMDQWLSVTAREPRRSNKEETFSSQPVRTGGYNMVKYETILMLYCIFASPRDTWLFKSLSKPLSSNLEIWT